MEGIIVNYRRGKRTQKPNQMIIMLSGVDSREKAQALVGSKVVFVCEGKEKKKISGEVRAAHGSKGSVRALFERGLPGQAIGQKVEVSE